MTGTASRHAALGGRGAVGQDAESAIVALLLVVMGDGRKDRGLMTRIVNGEAHVPTCMKGLWVEMGDSLRGGQPCSERCERAQVAVSWALSWIARHRPPVQAAMDLEVAG